MINFLDVNCQSTDIQALIGIIKNVVTYIQWGIVIVLILLLVLDIGKAALAGKEDEMKKAQSLAIKRVIYGLAVFLIPLVVRLVFGLINGQGDSTTANNVVECYFK